MTDPVAIRVPSRGVRVRVGPETAVAGAFGALGCVLLAARPFLPGTGSVLLLAVLYLGLGAGSLSDAPMERAAGERAATTFVVGLAAVFVARALVAPVVHPVLGAAGIGLTVLASVAEEAFFRRFLYGRLLRWGAPVAVGAAALLFAAVHVPAYGPAAFWVDLGAGVLLGWQRWASGTWLVPAATHVAANLLVVMG